MKHLLKMSDLSPAELHHILDVAEELKAEQKAGTTPALLKGRSVALMFSKNSTRTRTSFEVGVYQLGGLGNYMNAATELQSGRGEPLKDTARVLGRYYDCVVWRTYRQCDLEEFAVSGLRMVAAGAKDGKVIAANMWGKVKTVLQMLTIIFYYVGTALTWGNFIMIGADCVFLSYWLCWLVAIATAISGIKYLWDNRSFINTAK